MSPFNLKPKRIFLMASPAIFCLALLVAIPIIGIQADKKRDRRSKIHAEKIALYKARLEPCSGDYYQPDVDPLPLAPGEVAIEIFPSFELARGIRISENSIRAYNGASIYFYPPPPPPPTNASQTSQEESKLNSDFVLLAPVSINPALGKYLLRVLETEIDHADAEESIGKDGTTYLLRYGNKCATTWSPPDGTRADKIVRLVYELNRLTQPGSFTPSVVKTELRNVLIELESDRFLLDG